MEPEKDHLFVEKEKQTSSPQKDTEMEEMKDNAGPGAWEVTKGSRDPKSESVEISEEQRNEQALEALDEITKTMEQLAEDNTRYDLHVQLIELLQQIGIMEDELERAREQMHEIYPLTEAMWLAWINDAKKKADTKEGDEKLRELYDEAIRDYFSISIWNSFVDYILQKFDNQWDNEEKVKSTREALTRAVRSTEHHISESQQIWEKFINFEMHILQPNNSDENMQRDLDSKQIERIKQLYRDRLATLHTSSEETFNNYSTFNTNFDNQNYEESMLKANKLYSKIKAAAEVRDQFELQLKQSNNALEDFYAYIGYEKSTWDKYSLNHTRNLYERAVTIYCTDVGLWDNYITFLLEHVRLPAFLQSIEYRAIRNCPWSGILWAHYARGLEANNADKEAVIGCFDTALSNKNLLSSLEDMVVLLRAKCDYLRRLIDWSDPSEEYITDLRIAFEEALMYLNERFPRTPDPYYRIERYYAFVEHQLLDNEEKAREIWEERVNKRLGRCTDAWLSYIEFERSCGNIQKCQSLYKQAIIKNLDDPQRLTNVWLNMVHEIGTMDMLQDALVKVKQKENVLLHQWQEQAAVIETKKMKDDEKIIKQKKQKAQRRIQAKEKAKERRAQEYVESQQENQKDSDGFKIPIQPRKRRASGDLAESSETKKSKTDEEHKTEDQLDEGAGKTSGGGRPLGGRRGRGRAKVGLGYNSRKGAILESSSKEQQKQNTTKEEAGPSLPTVSKPKTQSDFRAMLLGKK